MAEVPTDHQRQRCNLVAVVVGEFVTNGGVVRHRLHPTGSEGEAGVTHHSGHPRPHRRAHRGRTDPQRPDQRVGDLPPTAIVDPGGVDADRRVHSQKGEQAGHETGRVSRQILEHTDAELLRCKVLLVGGKDVTGEPRSQVGARRVVEVERRGEFTGNSCGQITGRLQTVAPAGQIAGPHPVHRIAHHGNEAHVGVVRRDAGRHPRRRQIGR